MAIEEHFSKELLERQKRMTYINLNPKSEIKGMAALGHISLKIIHRYPSPLTFAASTKSMTIISIPNALESLKTTGEK